MTDGDGQSLSSAFDDMLKETRRELEGLYRGTPAPTGRDDRPAAPKNPPKPPSRPTRRGASSSDAERFLNDRYGDGWRQEVLEQKREGDEVVVLCKLTIDDHDITKTQFGRARVAGAASPANVTGTAGGIGFSLGGQGNTARASGADAEAAAFRAAAKDALAKCVAML